MNLVKYDAARHALEIAATVDEVKDFRDRAAAMAAYARQAKDTAMLEWVTEIKVRAERRAGQMLAEMPKAKGVLKSGKSPRSHDGTTATLDDLGINKNQSSRWQKLAAVTDEKFEQALAAAKEIAGEVTSASITRLTSEPKAKKEKPKPKEEKPEGNEEKDLLVSLEEADKQIRDLQYQNESLQKSDLGAELGSWQKKYAQLEGLLHQKNTTLAEATKTATYAMGLLTKIRKALGVEKNSQILAALAK